MKKDIYIIKNKINNKVYIGQSVNAAERYTKHLSDVRNCPSQIIHQAMAKYGIQNFWYEILEYQIENYDEREKYWIQHYNSVVPNGYNVAIGGQGVGSGIENPNAKIKDQKIINAIYEALGDEELTQKEIGEKYNVSQQFISAINLGQRYYNPDLNYPIRPERHYSEDLLKHLAYSLKYEKDKSLQDIANEYEIDCSQLSLINQGKIYARDWLEYPIRKGKNTSEIADFEQEIKTLLQTTTIPQKDIAKQFNVSVNAISLINLGKSYRQNDLNYPLRQNYQQQNKNTKSFSPDIMKRIVDDLKNSDISMRALSDKYECTITTIMNINTGSIKKYRLENEKYPLRKK